MTKFFNIIDILLITILVIPKINLIAVEGFDQGIRIDDFLIVFLIIYFFVLGKSNLKINKNFLLLIVFTAFNFFLSTINNSSFGSTVIFHYLRLLEYFVFFLFVINNLDKDRIIRIVSISFILISFYSIIEQLFLPIAPGSITSNIFGNTFIRANGTFAGPWEFSIFLGICFFIIADYLLKNKNNRYFSRLYIFLIAMIISSFSRAQFLAIFVSSLFLKNLKSFIRYLLLFSIIFLIGTILISQNIRGEFAIGYIDFSPTINFLRDYGLYTYQTFISGNFELGVGGRAFDVTAQYYDPSLVGRLQQWGRYLQTFNSAESLPLAIMFGMGPGSGGLINDGWYIKLFVDFGVIGTFIYFFYVLNYLLNSRTRPLLVFISISALTLDFFWATKITYIFLFAITYFNYKN